MTRTDVTRISGKGTEGVDMKLEVMMAPVSGDLAMLLAAPVRTTSTFETSYTVQGACNDRQAT